LNKSLIDTDMFSEITKAANPIVSGHASAYRKAFSRYTISAVTFMEVIRGHEKKQSFRQLQYFLAATVSEEVIPFDRPAAALAGRIAGELQRIGQTIGLADPMIAATAPASWPGTGHRQYRSFPTHPAARLSTRNRQLADLTRSVKQTFVFLIHWYRLIRSRSGQFFP
jgi:tRNA(fMet)-specific endonuclease VapC